ncbi:MAG: TetR/AcrR family transcriptional regulator [Mycobacterium sp.]
MEDIAVRAGVSRAFLYHHFPNKRDLYVAVFTRASRRFLARVSPDPQLPARRAACRRPRGAHPDFLWIIPLEPSRSTAALCQMTRQSRQSSPRSSTSWANA